MERFILTTKFILSLLVPLSCLLTLILIQSKYPNPQFQNISSFFLSKASLSLDPNRCNGRYIYMYDLPSRFNSDLVKDCHSLCPWFDMCKFVANSGMGPVIENSHYVLPKTGWYETDQFTLGILFHSRMTQYECLTTNFSIASAIYVPFYAGLDIGRHLWGYNVSVCNSLILDLIQWLNPRLEWQAHNGSDHFFVSGRITDDYRNTNEDDQSWGNKFMVLPETKNVTLLAIESAHYVNNEVAIPYPTYFHPSSEAQILSWKKVVRTVGRPLLFSFAGGRRPDQTQSIRDRLIHQCSKSTKCSFLDCGDYERCRSPSRLMHLFKRSKFCLQPSGDSYSRRSLFDSILSGCIPVFFHPGSAYVQYIWHFPKNETDYSVFIPEDEVRKGKVKIEEVLSKYSEDQVREMRENVINMIPKIIYKNPKYKLENIRDAFDIAIDGVIERVKRKRHGLAPMEEEKKKWANFFVAKKEEDYKDFFGVGNKLFYVVLVSLLILFVYRISR